VADFDINSTEEGKELAYDLRQYNAKVTGEIMMKHGIMRDEKRFVEIFDTLTNLYDEVDYKLNDEEQSEWDEKYNQLLKIINDNQSAFIGTSNNSDERYTIDLKLRELYRWLKRKMEEHGIFGGRYDDEGL
jgi:hypothetical protein